MNYEYVIVGAGLSGLTIAERIADKLHKEVLIIEKRDHIGGNCWDSYNKEGILIHNYGPHIFHTNYKEVWDYIGKFTVFNYYIHRVLTYIDGMFIPMPITADTINSLYNLNLTNSEVEEFLCKQAEKKVEINNSEDVVLSKAGRDIFEKFFMNYTKKQWDLYPGELDASVISRIPVRYNRDTRYFTDRYQGIPKHGYSNMVLKMTESPNIHILLKTDYKQVINDIGYKVLIYTGPVDYFFDYKYGKLKYRSIRFEYETLNRRSYQSAAVVNYPNDYDFTRISEFKKMTDQITPNTTIMREYPTWDGEPYYPYPTKECNEQYDLYKEDCLHSSGVLFIGRLAEYKYYNMDMAIKRALDVFNNEIMENDKWV